MRQSHAGGDKLFVDYAGDTVPVIVDRRTGEIRPAQIFVAHTRAFVAVGGVPRLLVPDNTKVAVIKACLYEPQVNRTYAEMAALRHCDPAGAAAPAARQACPVEERGPKSKPRC